MNPLALIGIILVLILAGIEYRYSLRIDITKEGDVLLWFNTRKGCRHYKHLFKLKQ